MKTFSAKASDVKRQWWVIDAAGQHLGHVAVKAANILRGKGKAIFTPHVDTGDFVIVINADKVRVGGKKDIQKTYMSFSGFVGGHKSETFAARRERHPELLIERAVRGMIPHNRLGSTVYRKLKVYRGSEHPHVAQNPKNSLIVLMSDIIATGRRKTSVAQIRMRKGNGVFKINGKDFTDYFPSLSMQNTILRPLEIANSVQGYDVDAKASGGGITGQAGALRLAISRALVETDETLRVSLRAEGLLTRDPRMKERKKSGQPGARKRFQFSKR